MENNDLRSLRKNLDFLCRRWHFLVLFSLLSGPKRFNEIKRHIGNNVSSKSLSTALKCLCDNEFVEKRIYEDPENGIAHYYLTDKGMHLEGVYTEIQRWNGMQTLGMGSF